MKKRERFSVSVGALVHPDQKVIRLVSGNVRILFVPMSKVNLGESRWRFEGLVKTRHGYGERKNETPAVLEVDLKTRDGFIEYP